MSADRPSAEEYAEFERYVQRQAPHSSSAATARSAGRRRRAARGAGYVAVAVVGGLVLAVLFILILGYVVMRGA